MLSKSDIQIIREEIVVPMNKRFDRLETEFYEFRIRVDRNLEYLNQFAEYSKEQFENINKTLEAIYRLSNSKTESMQNIIADAGDKLQSIKDV